MDRFREVLQEILLNHTHHAKWVVGDFIGIKVASNTAVGVIGQEFIESICLLLEMPVEFPLNKKKVRAKQSPWDIKIQNVAFELKTATEDTKGRFQFNHIRLHRDYDAVLCLGISPNELHFNVWSKADIATKKAGNLVSMEKSGNASYKLSKSKSSLLPIDMFKEVICSFTEKFQK